MEGSGGGQMNPRQYGASCVLSDFECGYRGT